MKNKKLILSILLLAALSIIYFGCKKEKGDTDQRSAIDNAIAENMFNDVFKQVDNAAKRTTQAGAKYTQFDTCATLTISSLDTLWPKTLTIDFGTSNCLCSDMKYRRGKIIANLTGRYRDSATVITVTLDNYYVNDNHVEGTKVIINLGHVGIYNGGNNLEYKIVVSNARITTVDGIITWESTRYREWIEGESTTGLTAWQDDVYLITGNANGTDINGKNYTATITSSLRVALNCRWIESGTIEVAPEGLAVRTLDFGYGTGGCDNQAKLTINGVDYYFAMN